MGINESSESSVAMTARWRSRTAADIVGTPFVAVVDRDGDRGPGCLNKTKFLRTQKKI